MEPNPLNVLRKIYTDKTALVHKSFDVIIPGACKLLGLGKVTNIEGSNITL